MSTQAPHLRNSSGSSISQRLGYFLVGTAIGLVALGFLTSSRQRAASQQAAEQQAAEQQAAEQETAARRAEIDQQAVGSAEDPVPAASEKQP